jgi:hypothetical protein
MLYLYSLLLLLFFFFTFCCVFYPHHMSLLSESKSFFFLVIGRRGCDGRGFVFFEGKSKRKKETFTSSGWFLQSNYRFYAQYDYNHVSIKLVGIKRKIKTSNKKWITVVKKKKKRNEKKYTYNSRKFSNSAFLQSHNISTINCARKTDSSISAGLRKKHKTKKKLIEFS